MSSLTQNQYKKKNYEIYIFNDFATQYREIEDVALTISLFNNEKLLIVENCQFLTSSTNSALSEEAQEVYMHLIKNKPVDFIFTATHEKLDERKKITKYTKEQIEVVSLKDDAKTALKILYAILKTEKIIMPDAMLNQLLIQANNNVFHAHSEIHRFVLQYKTSDFTNIAIPEIQKIPDEDIFYLGDFIVQNDYLALIQELKRWSVLHPQQSEFQRVLRYLFNHAKLIYEVQHLKQKNYTYSDIGKLLSVHEYRVKLLMGNIHNINEKLLETFINSLIEGDYLMKTGVVDRLLYVEMKIRSAM